MPATALDFLLGGGPRQQQLPYTPDNPWSQNPMDWLGRHMPQPLDVFRTFGGAPAPGPGTYLPSWGDVGGRGLQSLYDQVWPNPYPAFNPYPDDWDPRNPGMIAPEGWGPVF